ncbi:MAG: ABC transporter substrate-binding protein [Oscillospiraceae bacterium]|nr:ABC transporter substrate-binding protein [Oscillospiraceae bacterium]
MKHARRTIVVLLCVTMLLLMVAGCNRNEPQESQTQTESPDTTEPVRDDIVIGIAQDIDVSLDPHLMTSAASRAVLFNVFEGLVKPTPEGFLAPAVASSFEISESGDTFTFTLRDNILFHNGEPVTAQDVVYSISRVSGFYNDGTALIPAFSIVESVTAEDENTIVIKTTVPNIEFLSFLTAAIIPENYDAQETAPVGTGPYMYVSRSPQENLIFEKFDDYWGDVPSITHVTYRILDNTEALMMALRSGTVDFCSHLMSSQMAELQGLGYNFEIGTMNLVQAVYLNNAVAPFDNVEVRRALAHAINRSEIMDVLADGLGVPVGSSMYPAFSKYFTAELADYYDYDPQKAKSLLSEAGYPDGFTMEIVVPSNHGPHIDTATVVVEQLREIGVTATIRLVEWSTWIDDTYRGRNFEATVVGVDASAMTARAMLERFSSTNGSNFINFSNAEYDEVFAAAISATNDEDQVLLYKELELILTQQAANLYIQDLCDIIAINEDISGFEFYPLFVEDLARLYYK